MISINAFRKIALKFPEAKEEPHFEKISFRVNKKIFATLDIKKKQACIKLPEVDQDVFSSFDNSAFFAVPNKWGKQGWTFINLEKARKDMILDALKISYRGVASKKLLSMFKKP